MKWIFIELFEIKSINLSRFHQQCILFRAMSVCRVPEYGNVTKVSKTAAKYKLSLQIINNRNNCK